VVVCVEVCVRYGVSTDFGCEVGVFCFVRFLGVEGGFGYGVRGVWEGVWGCGMYVRGGGLSEWVNFWGCFEGGGLWGVWVEGVWRGGEVGLGLFRFGWV